jgi:hypothetical protein
MKHLTTILIGFLVSSAWAADIQDAPLPALRLPNGEPLTCIYFFGHWWEPWMSSDDAIRRDLQRLRELGFNTLLLDHQFSQMLAGNWRLIDREHRLAKEAGFSIVPWLEGHCSHDIAPSGRRDVARKMFGLPEIPLTETQDGKPHQALITSEGFKQYLTAYACAYVERHLKDGALLRVVRDGKPRPVISLGCEMDYTAFDTDTNRRFVAWLQKKYSDVARLNAAWRSQFARFEDVNPKDQSVFDCSHLEKPPSPAVADHVSFRAQLCNGVFAEIKERVRQRFPELLFLSEVPYPFESDHPHARGYAVSRACIPDTVRFADILMLRWTQGRPTPKERAALSKYVAETGAQTIICYRTSELLTGAFATDTAKIANGLGYYSWNEMVDCHAVENPPDVGIAAHHIDAATSTNLVRRMKEVNEVWRGIHKQ